MQPVFIPDSHRGLFDGDACVALTTIMPDGQPQITPVWCNLDRGLRVDQHDARISQRKEHARESRR